ncbi:MAG TPA: porin [Herbaspirillum sp.]|jgi:predicted porin
MTKRMLKKRVSKKALKKALVTAITVLSISPLAVHAQSAVTVYGIVDTGLTIGAGGPHGTDIRMSSGVQDVSRWGIIGKEDIGNKMAVIFKLEDGFLSDTGAGDTANTIFSRQSTVGLTGGFGTVNVGLQFTPMYKVLSPLTPFGNAFGGSPGQLMSGEKAGTRAANQVVYDTPDLHSFRGEIAYSLGEVPGDYTANQQLGLSMGYDIGPARIEFAHNQKNDVANINVAKNELLTAKIDLGLFVTHLGFGVNRGPSTTDSRDILVGVSKKFLGVHEIYFAYQHKNDLNNHFFNASEGTIDYTYSLSKRTNLYIAATKLSNIRFTTTKFGTGDREFDFGIRHRF